MVSEYPNQAFSIKKEGVDFRRVVRSSLFAALASPQSMAPTVSMVSTGSVHYGGRTGAEEDSSSLATPSTNELPHFQNDPDLTLELSGFNSPTGNYVSFD